MKLSAARPSDHHLHKVYLLQKPEELSHLDLNDEEKEYAQNKIGKEGISIVRINRYREFLYLVKIPGDNFSETEILEQCRIAGNKLQKQIASSAESVFVTSISTSLSSIAFSEGIALGAYQFLKYFSDEKKRRHKLHSIAISDATREELNELSAVIKGAYLARDLINEPLSYLTATQLASEASTAGEKLGIKVEVLNKKRIETMKFGGLLAVNRGSQDPPTFTIMEYQPSEPVNSRPVVLVGKGVVYDTGGLSLKPTAGSMDSMKSDMSGAAAVIGAMIAVANAKLPVHLIALIPATDNRPGEKAYVPGDIIQMYNGSTVEVLNTDAEGRMILADALTYADKYKPELVVDVATLTGAAAVAIGKYGIVAMGNAPDEEFSHLEDSGKKVHERIARFPFWNEYNDLLKSSVADVKNIGGREGGAITAGKFLERFTKSPYIHLDIAGPAFLDNDDHYRLRGGTGAGVRLLFDFLKSRK